MCWLESILRFQVSGKGGERWGLLGGEHRIALEAGSLGFPFSQALGGSEGAFPPSQAGSCGGKQNPSAGQLGTLRRPCSCEIAAPGAEGGG